MSSFEFGSHVRQSGQNVQQRTVVFGQQSYSGINPFEDTMEQSEPSSNFGAAIGAPTPGSTSVFGSAPVFGSAWTQSSQPQSVSATRPVTFGSSASFNTPNALVTASSFGVASSWGSLPDKTQGHSSTSSSNPFVVSMPTYVNDSNIAQRKSFTIGAGKNNNSDDVLKHGFGQSHALTPSLFSAFGSTSNNTPDNSKFQSNLYDSVFSDAPSNNLSDQGMDDGAEEESETRINCSKAQELEQLKAKLAEKKRQLEEKKKKILQSQDSKYSQNPQMPQTTSDSTIAEQQDTLSGNLSESPKRHVLIEKPTTYLEEQNSSDQEEFDKEVPQSKGKNRGKSKPKERVLLTLLPAELQEAALVYKPQTSVEEQMADQEPDKKKSSSKSLRGKCPFMCPNEELIRREYENDIQLLEITHADIHPKGWNLRNTAVKRFRRSAAAFRLDIPILVRPPVVLEQTVAYMEEWVMERDRQGIDVRYAGTPPSLDVYQFIWDRTRMIRKDFILQNYIAGAGGMCSAVAVRCHERIARWHICMEHQLSHLADYVKQQSVQNIQELGQTLKTLNLYYDDPLERSIVPEPDEMNGSNIVSYHGCQNTTVQGPSPKDYNGNKLYNNDEKRSLWVVTQGHGTAEPEMRGLYILLTMPNDGGMEVLKYVGSLCVKRPHVFHSKPVQLALAIFRARKERNWAKFFSILRDPGTPYLFACLMFSYVEEMRKWALFLMSKTFGVRRKDDGVGIDDSYQLSSLIHVLCFEDENEARLACAHYGITVSDDDVEGPIILWKKSRFKDPRDPNKGTHISLKPQKMIKTIEAKLMGATRLAICRGQICGEGATLKPESPNPTQLLDRENTQEQKQKQQLRQNQIEEENKRCLLLQAEECKKKHQQDMESLRMQQQEADEHLKAQQEHQKVVNIAAKVSALEVEERRQQMEAEECRQKMKAEERRQQMEAERFKKEQHERELSLKVQEEERKKAYMHLENKRKEQERQRLFQLELQAQLESQRRIEQERLKHLEEHRRREEVLRVRREQEETERARQVKAELEHLERLWHQQISNAQKHTICKALCCAFEIRHQKRLRRQSLQSLAQLEPTQSGDCLIRQLLREKSMSYGLTRSQRLYDGAFFHQLAKKNIPIQLANRVLNNSKINCHLLSVALVFPHLLTTDAVAVKAWLSARLSFNQVHKSANLRIVFSDSDYSCDAAIFVVPPGMCDYEDHESIFQISFKEFKYPAVLKLSCMLKNLATPPHHNYKVFVARAHECFGDQLEQALASCVDYLICRSVADQINIPPVVIPASLLSLGYEVINRVIWSEQEDGNLVQTISSSLYCLSNTIKAVHKASVQKGLSQWPYPAFANEVGIIQDYFGEGRAGLPLDWLKLLNQEYIVHALESLFTNQLFKITLDEQCNNISSLCQIIVTMVSSAPQDLKYDCKVLIEKKLFRRSFIRALGWLLHSKRSDPMTNVYLPMDYSTEYIVEETEKLFIKLLKKSHTNFCQLENSSVLTYKELDEFQDIHSSIKAPSSLLHNLPIIKNLEGSPSKEKSRNLHPKTVKKRRICNLSLKTFHAINPQELLSNQVVYTSSIPQKKNKMDEKRFSSEHSKSKKFTADLEALLNEGYMEIKDNFT